MKTRLRFIFPLALLFLQACNNREPGITWRWEKDNKEKRFFVGQQIPLTADIDGGDRLDSAWLAIKAINDGNWSYLHPLPSALFRDNKPYRFEHRVDVPDTANTGRYEVGLFARLSDGSVIKNLEYVDLSVDSSFPWIGDLEIGLNGRQDDLHLAAELSAAKKIDKVNVQIDGANWKNSFDFQGSSLKDQITAHFHEHVDLKDVPVGAYSVKLVLTDGLGRTTEKKGTFNKTK